MMDVPKGAHPFWDRFQASIACDSSLPFYEALHLDDNEGDANALGALVPSGQKRATAGFLWTYERTNRPLPAVGALSVVTDWQGTPSRYITPRKGQSSLRLIQITMLPAKSSQSPARIISRSGTSPVP